jgi:hypothetical protein
MQEIRTLPVLEPESPPSDENAGTTSDVLGTGDGSSLGAGAVAGIVAGSAVAALAVAAAVFAIWTFRRRREHANVLEALPGGTLPQAGFQPPGGVVSHHLLSHLAHASLHMPWRNTFALKLHVVLQSV